jgi:hypothetical protein
VDRLFVGYGMTPVTYRSGLGNYRLLAESRGTEEMYGRDIHTSRYKLFGVVAGAELTIDGATPNAVVQARVLVVTNNGGRLIWATDTVADAHGHACLRVPYATGANGASVASPYVVSDGVRDAKLTVPEAAIAGGAAIPVELAATSEATRPAARTH